MNAALARQFEPFGFAAAIHAMRAGRRVTIIALGAVTAHQFALGQPMEKRRVLLVTVNVIDLEMGANGERVHRKDFGAALDLG